MNPVTSSHTFPGSTRRSPEKSLRIQGLDVGCDHITRGLSSQWRILSRGFT
jgi:hypothetical protein